MISTLLMSLFSMFFDLLAILRTSKSENDLEILILRQQVRILQRKTKRLREYLTLSEWYWRPSWTSIVNSSTVHTSILIRSC